MKTFCPIHCFNYTGNKCPYCEQDRIRSYAKRYVKKNNIINEQKDSPSADDINRLIEHFNGKN